jgi:hypothetical protein
MVKPAALPRERHPGATHPPPPPYPRRV